MADPVYRGTARVAHDLVGHRDGAPYVPPATLPPRPEWLRLGARVSFVVKMSERCYTPEITATVGIVSIRPKEGGWEVMGHKSAHVWIDASVLQLVEPAPADYSVWPRSNVNLLG